MNVVHWFVRSRPNCSFRVLLQLNNELVLLRSNIDLLTGEKLQLLEERTTLQASLEATENQLRTITQQVCYNIFGVWLVCYVSGI